ncbi:uncharacterized protein METZ01_LOCUS406023, partial [marine metagenome]
CSATTKNAIFISVTPSLFGSDRCRTDQLGRYLYVVKTFWTLDRLI